MPQHSPRQTRLTTAALTERARAFRRELTPAERLLWSRVRNHQLYGLHIRRQVPIERFNADFFYAPARLVIEIDGDVHAEQPERDAARSEWFASRGYCVIRFDNADVLSRLEGVLESIAQACQEGKKG